MDRRLTAFVLGAAYLGRVVHAPAGGRPDLQPRAAVHHLHRAVETSVDTPAIRDLLDITWALLITLTAIAEVGPGPHRRGRAARPAALERTGFSAEFRPRARGGIAIALNTLHQLTGRPRRWTRRSPS